MRLVGKYTKPVSALVLSGALILTACGTSQESSKEASSSSAMTAKESAVVNPVVKHLDMQAHRGGRGEHTEESLAAFEHALSLGVSTLEFDIVMSKDGVPVVWHDPDVQEEKCRDTEPAMPNDPQFPYVGKLLHDLTWEQLSTLRCDKKLEKFPDAEPAKDNQMIRLERVFQLTKERGADVMYNIETKIEADHPEKSAEPQEFVDAILTASDNAGVTDKVMLQSFDWRSLPLAKKHNPKIRTVALYDETTWLEGSPWLGDIDYKSVNGDALEAVKKLGADIVSPGYAVPYGKTVADSDYKPVTTPEYVKKAHDLGLKVVPWTVNDKATMKSQIEAGIDGIITDYPTILRELAEEMNLDLPVKYPAK
ncbi:glycerophosphodiester phosphodiesterase [Corynebacterium pseudotuberculosis]|uniref:glycerophosphodiester phosphodiesterase family protein n=1 Tax=Corynebacterium pseudotuberculosis TaxID=1719 RepID=UPI00023248DD|nr:glycerophosphodiester phosphodiesterase family protein [Corynebacterium pseudotuberculosis]AER69956.1 Glycerophosphoryl diester phosphodiesterase [Corynebacterium pseudotuberculosis 1/06-A]AFB73301.1 glycerophosphodiester phosphodiesterase [Corynebacterium pseudotuberculosis 316]AMN70784.1 glycerophosphodiester phosphodiesterase [Corynebacterium pseudotuberculosis]AMN72641.1 glycerophosphodiester phosphodiesterase [Corynebacterium pseudotuberculosis]AMN74502.1 glycerophosphodiester phosphod